MFDVPFEAWRIASPGARRVVSSLSSDKQVDGTVICEVDQIGLSAPLGGRCMTPFAVLIDPSSL